MIKNLVWSSHLAPGTLNWTFHSQNLINQTGLQLTNKNWLITCTNQLGLKPVFNLS